MAIFHELIAALLPDHPFYSKCMAAQKFDLGEIGQTLEMAKAVGRVFCRSPAPLALFQIVDATGTTHFLLVDESVEGDEVSIRFVRFGKWADGWKEPNCAVKFTREADGRVMAGVYSDFGCDPQTELPIDFDGPNAYDSIHWTFMLCDILLSAFSVFSCCNVSRVENKPPKFINAKRMQKGRVPFFSYWTLHINQEGSARHGKSASAGTHASPRLHFRRGHIRNLQDGRKVWVTAHLVGDKSKGLVGKEYVVEHPDAR